MGSAFRADICASSEIDLQDKAKELMSSRSSVHAMKDWPRPMVYLPLGTPSKTSRSSWEMHCGTEKGT